MGQLGPHLFLTHEVKPVPLPQVSAVLKSRRSPQAQSWRWVWSPPCLCTQITPRSLGHLFPWDEGDGTSLRLLVRTWRWWSQEWWG